MCVVPKVDPEEVNGNQAGHLESPNGADIAPETL